MNNIYHKTKLIWIDNLLLFKIIKKYSYQSLCICANSYKIELEIKIGDIIIIKDKDKNNTYIRLGSIKAFNGNKVIVSIMSDIKRSKIKKLHNEINL